MTKPPNSVLLTFPYPPSINNYYRGGGRRYLNIRAFGHRADVGAAILDQYRHLQPMTGRLRLVAAMFPPDRRTRDMDNPVKGLFDSLEFNSVFLNDSQIDDFRIVRQPCTAPPGRVVVSIAELSPQEQADLLHVMDDFPRHSIT